MTNLNDAFDALRAALKTDGFSDGIVERTAEDWDVKAPLLARMFKEKTGRAPEEFKAVNPETLGSSACARFLALRARERAADTAFLEAAARRNPESLAAVLLAARAAK